MKIQVNEQIELEKIILTELQKKAGVNPCPECQDQHWYCGWLSCTQYGDYMAYLEMRYGVRGDEKP